ncbi:aldehyde dehydrogenase family protein [Pseudomonas sp. NGC7]|uniref:aldehyde dehydrogenase family protein n=1 Tax=Pseudomonas sp. NGC7 TaxID=3341775 RepID=UPI0037DADE9B
MKFKLLIGGNLVRGARSLDVINPATGQVFEQCARADMQQLEDAVSTAHFAFPTWSRRTTDERASFLLKLADALEARQDEMATLITLEQGKPLSDAVWEVAGSVACLRYTATLDLPLRTLRTSENERIVEQRVPHGVVATITPWNVPLILLVMKLAPALLAGNTVVSKPAPTTPLSTLLLGEIAVDILPAGVFNTIVDDNDLGSALSAHPDIAMVSFTGSTATGRKVMATAAGTIKRVTLELGGNDPAILLEDIDIDEVIPKVFAAAMINNGQVCLAAKRIYVPASIYEPVCAALAKLAENAVVGNGLEKGVHFGPIQNAQQFEKLKTYLRNAHDYGVVIAGGNVIDRPGYFIQPTVVRDIEDDAAVVHEEQFGPIIPVLSYDALETVIERANNSEFGLGATVWSTNIDKAYDVACQLTAGTVWVNQHLAMPFDIPVGGAKQSGLGVQQGIKGLEEFTQLKIINMKLQA